MRLKQLRHKRKDEGFSIVELMVAILIGLIILAGVIQVVVTSKTTFLGQEEMSFIQENARYAMDVLGKDIQGAGYKGCAGQDARIALVAGAANTNSAAFVGVESILGYAGELGAPAAYVNKLGSVGNGSGKSESILIRSFVGPESIIQSHSSSTLTFAGTNPHGFSAGDYLGIVAEDCQRIGVIRISARTNNSVSYTAADNNGMPTIKPSLETNIICPGSNCSTSFVQNYNPGAVAMNYVAQAYYVGDSSALSGVPALKRAVLRRTGEVIEEEIALGVEDIHFRYGIRNGSNLTYVQANHVTDWNQVISVEVSVMMRSQTASLPAAESKIFGASGRTYNDKYMRQVVTTTFRIRNRI
ncbi:PilW family protein [Saccharophagus sp. K07]|mgnify:CR=1 FL=1|uniref:PilW family protein n=1 Tax=Saccharophagus sp. K07 TaxID=2283636 RepID=UPI001651DA24|nr:PilW family protein [Saccharophagus sp. K07]